MLGTQVQLHHLLNATLILRRTVRQPYLMTGSVLGRFRNYSCCNRLLTRRVTAKVFDAFREVESTDIEAHRLLADVTDALI